MATERIPITATSDLTRNRSSVPLGISPAELRETTLTTVRRGLEDNRGSRLGMTRDWLRHLERMELIAASEATTLENDIEGLFGVARGKRQRDEVAAQVRAGSQLRLAEGRSTALGTSLSNMVVDQLSFEESGESEEERIAARKKLPMPVQGAIGGAYIGAIIGGGAAGALVGAGVGFAVGAAQEAC